MRRGASRALAVLALLAAAGALAVILLGGRGGGTGDGGPTTSDRSPRPTSTVRVTLASGTAVRNATPQPDWRPHPGPVPIFRYDTVGEVGPAESYPELIVSPADFTDQMDWLEEHGYEAVDLETVERAWSAGGTLPAKPVVLTFDGVEGDLLEAVLPDLSRRGWPGVLVVDPGAAAKDTPEVARLVAKGWELEAEGGDPSASRRSLESRFATEVRNFALPPGESADGGEIATLKRAGFEGATATGAGFAESRRPFDQPRITIFGLSRVEGFVEALRSRGAGVGA